MVSRMDPELAAVPAAAPGAALDAAAPSTRTAFAGLFLAAWPAFASIGAVLPVLPRYVQGPLRGGDVAVGVVTGAFALSAVVCRPLAGRMADARGRRIVVVGGALLMALAGALYLVPAGIAGLVVARLALGAGEAGVFTAGATWTVDLAPEHRRGQAIGLFGLAIWSALALGPLLGEALYRLGGYDAVWLFAAASPLLGAVLARRLPERHAVGGRVAVDHPAHARRRPLLPVAALRPGAALALANVGYAALSAFVVLHLARNADGHGPAVFAAFAAAVVGARLLGGRLPDRLGPTRCAIAAGCAEALGLAAIGVATAWWTAVVGALAMGAGFSLLFPSLALLVVNRVRPSERGAALGTFTAFFDLGVGLGAPLAGVVAALAGYPAAFLLGAGCALGSALVVAGLRVATRAGEPVADVVG